MGIDRVIYNAQALFVAPYSGEQSAGKDYFLSNTRILKRIEKLQSFNYSIQKNELNAQGFGQKQNIFRGQGLAPEASFNFSYIPDGVTNENRLDFNVNHFSGSNLPMFSGICSNSENLNKRDFYLVVGKNNNDIFSDNATFNNSIINPTNETQVIDSNCRNDDIIHFQNCHLNEYSFNVSIGNLPEVNQSYVADNITYYTSGSGIKYSYLNLSSGINIQNHETIIVPKSLNYNQTVISGQNILLPGDANVSFFTNNRTGVLFYTDTIQNLDYSLSFNRKAYRAINYKLPLLRKIEFPVNGKLNTSFIVDQTLSGSFFDTLNRDDDYNIVVDFNSSKRGVDKTRLSFSGCKFDNITYDSSIGANKTATLSFNFDLDPDFGRRGLFASGNALYVSTTGLLGLESNINYLLSGTEGGIQYDLSSNGKTILNY